jgi:hypothetical protein
MRQRRTLSRPAAVVCLTALLAVFAVGGTLSGDRPRPPVVVAPKRPAPPAAFLSWALLDRDSGKIVGSDNLAETTDTASMIKGWLAADYLRRSDEFGEEPDRADLADLATMIRNSDNDVADRTFEANGGPASIERMISLCHLTESAADQTRWSNTVISARDAVRMGECLADGRAAGEWTSWLLHRMREVRGVGDFGIRDAVDDDERDEVAIKNGWLLRDEDNAWHTNCLAISGTWVIAVLQRYPSRNNPTADFIHTAMVCTQVARRLLSTFTSTEHGAR